MRLRRDFIQGLARRLPGVDGFAAVAAAVGDPGPLLERPSRAGAVAQGDTAEAT